MAHPIASHTFRGVHLPSLTGGIERFILRTVTARAEAARDAVSQYESLAGRLTRSLKRQRIPSHPTLAWFVGAQVALWRTVDELEAHSDRQLADIQIPREAIKAVAVLAAYGWPRQETVPAVQAVATASAPSLGARLRRRFFPTSAELEEAYLSGATDMHDLEYRMREWDRRLAGGDRNALYSA